MDPDRDIERLLEDERPMPDPAWRVELREQLFDQPSRRRFALPALRWRPVAVGGGAAAAVVLAAGIAGGGPLGSSSDEPVSAKDRCTTVTVMQTKRVPRVVRKADGELVVRYRMRQEPVRVKRCR